MAATSFSGPSGAWQRVDRLASRGISAVLGPLAQIHDQFVFAGRILRRLPRALKYRKEILSWSVPFSTWMPYASYFSGGFAMHSYPSVPAYPASHGCVRLPAVEAPGVYAFAGYGTPVWIR